MPADLRREAHDLIPAGNMQLRIARLLWFTAGSYLLGPEAPLHQLMCKESPPLPLCLSSLVLLLSSLLGEVTETFPPGQSPVRRSPGLQKLLLSQEESVSDE